MLSRSGIAISTVSAVVTVWLLYLAVKVAEHVGAWPF